MKVLRFFESLLVLVVGMAISSCEKNDTPISQIEDKAESNIEEITVETLRTEINSNVELYKTAAKNNPLFDFNSMTIVECSLPSATRNYCESKECVLFYSKTDSSQVLAFMVDKEYGIEKGAIFEFHHTKDILYSTTYDLNNNKLFDCELNKNTFVGTITNVYFDETTTRLNGCNAAIYAAGLPWQVGFSMVNPAAGFLAGLAFYLLEDYICG